MPKEPARVWTDAEIAAEIEAEMLINLKNTFWHKLGLITAEALADCPEERRNDFLMELQDCCSVYGTRYSELLVKIQEDRKTEYGA